LNRGQKLKYTIEDRNKFGSKFIIQLPKILKRVNRCDAYRT